MKILQLVYSLESGGAERFVVDLSNNLANQLQNEVILVIIKKRTKAENIHYLQDVSPNVKFVSLNCDSGLTIKAFWRVLQIIRKEKPDVVHAHCQVLQLFLPSVFFPRIKFFHTLHSMPTICLAFKRLKWLYRLFYKNSIFPITISATCQQAFIDLYHIKRVKTIPNGRSPIVTTSEYHAVRDTIKQMKTNDETPVFIHVARCNHLKNQKRLFNVFERLQNEGIDFLLICIGRGYETEFGSKYKDNKQIRILGQKNNVGDYLAVSDFFVLSSDYEGLPISLLEAMSIGVIPISTPAGGVKDVINDGKNGYISEAIDDRSLYNKIKFALENKGNIHKEDIINDYQQKYSMDTCAELYNNLYLASQ